MPIITKPATIEKDSPATFTLDKDALAALPVVSSNTWYGDKTRWKFVTLNYMSEEYGEMIFVRFDATQASPEADFLAIIPAQDVFQILSISITDFNNGTFRVPSSALVASEFEVDMSIVSPPPVEPLPNLVFTRDYSNHVAGDDGFEGGAASNYGVAYLNGYYTYLNAGNNNSYFRYDVTAGSYYNMRVYFDAASVHAGMVMTLQHTGHEWSYYNTTLTQQQVAQGYFQIQAMFGWSIGTSHSTRISVVSYAQPTDVFRISKIEIGTI